MLALITGSTGAALGERFPAVGRETPYGETSAPVRQCQTSSGTPWLQLSRHGEQHLYAPHEINYLANLHALKEAGATEVLAICTVGSIDPTFEPGRWVVPDQLIDYTWGRPSTFGGVTHSAPVNHIEFAEPFDAGLRERVVALTGAASGGVYACTQGPRLETAAEIRRLDRDGCTLVGMTACPEAPLACELGLPYALLCLVVNPAAGVGETISLEEISAVGRRGAEELEPLVDRFLDGG